jgi:hypothetical protein
VAGTHFQSLHLGFTFPTRVLTPDLYISSGLCLPQPRANNMKKSFMYDGAKLWNSIPNEIRESKSLSCFQKKIAAHIFN